MNLQYSDIFARRGDAYHAAMQKEPAARNAEFLTLFARHPIRPGESLLDIPAGGGYLSRVLPKNVAVTELELSAGFTPHLRVVDATGDWNVGAFDHAVCLAGLHHIADQEGFVARLARHVRPGGIVHVADVDASTPHGAFLDGFVGRYNVTGHEGKYLTRDSFRHLPGLKLLSSEIRDCPWVFASEERLLDFAADLFGLVAYPRDRLNDELHRIGFSSDGDGVVLHWQLRYVDLEVEADGWGTAPAS